MAHLVHVTAENLAARIRRNGLAPRRFAPDPDGHPEHQRVVWTFPVLASFTLTHAWSRELKRRGYTTLAAITVRIPDDETVYVRHYSGDAVATTAGSAVGVIRALTDPRGYEILVPRRIDAGEIVRIRTLTKAIGWRYWPNAKNRPLRTCDCPYCMPAGEPKAARYRASVRRAIARSDPKPFS